MNNTPLEKFSRPYDEVILKNLALNVEFELSVISNSVGLLLSILADDSCI